MKNQHTNQDQFGIKTNEIKSIYYCYQTNESKQTTCNIHIINHQKK